MKQNHHSRLLLFFLITMLLVNCIPFSPFNNNVSAAVENLTTYTEIDALNKYTVTSSRITVTGIEAETTGHWVYKNFTNDYFQEYVIDWDFWCMAPDGFDDYTTGVTVALTNGSLSDTSDMYGQWAGFYVSGAANEPVYGFFGDYQGTLNTQRDQMITKFDPEQTIYYMRLSRSGTTLNYSVYTDSARTTLFASGELVNMSSQPYTTLYVAQSYGYGNSDSPLASFYTENYWVNSTNSSYPAATTSDATNISYASVQLNGNLGYFGINETNTTCYFQYGLTDSYGTNTSEQNISVLGSVTENPSGLFLNTTYHYRIVGNNTNDTAYSSDKTFTTLSKDVDAPTNGVVVFTPPSTLNLTWVKDSDANNTIIVYKTDTYPTSISDGTVWYNGTNDYFETSVVNQYYYIRAWSEGNWSGPDYYNLSSDNLTFDYGGITLNCYDENTSDAIPSWSVFISDVAGSNTYENMTTSNPLFINIYEFPYGDDTIFVFNATEYSQRIYYIDIVINQEYTLNAYLSPENTTQLCVIQVYGPQTDYGGDPPIEDATVTISQYINDTVGFEAVTIDNTDANGRIYIYLVTDALHHISISKSGYNTEITTFIVDSDIQLYPFRLTAESVVSPEYDLFSEDITFVCTMVDAGYMQLGNITVVYSDSNSSTTNTDIYLYENYNGTRTLISSASNTSNSFNLVFSSINTSRQHYVVLYFNNTADYTDIVSPYSVSLNLLHIYSSDSPDTFSFDDRVTSLVGPMIINGQVVGWHTLVAVFLGIIVLVLLDPFHTGIALIGSGLVIGLTDALFSMWFTDVFPSLLVTLAPLLVFLGILYTWTKRGGEDQL